MGRRRRTERRLEIIEKKFERAGLHLPDFRFQEGEDCIAYKSTIPNNIEPLDIKGYFSISIQLSPRKSVSRERLLSSPLNVEDAVIDFLSVYGEFKNCSILSYIEAAKILTDIFIREYCEMERLRKYLKANPPPQQEAILYGKFVKEGKLRWFDIIEDFPYVLAGSEEIDGTGLSAGGLYFIAECVATKPWQEFVIAAHQRYKHNPELAKAMEAEVIKRLHVDEQEYKQWKAVVREKFGMY
ncbi:MAG TPA: hypothetical protein ENG42_01420 [Candidatus Aenigmarchaeota archaeon]|nr:MAG: hypothetical protein DRP03_01185 [Candidatus Aenigmarchaeota archaeon]HDD46110.1 hypothetical protein [Candidatus Aenigmarchaeota archaeon]